MIKKQVLLALAFSAASSLAFAAGADKPMGAAGSDKPMGAAGSDSGAAGSSGATTGAGASAGTSFSDLDKDGNGYIDAGESAGVSELDATTADTDNDGRLSRSEYEAAMKGGAGGTGAGTPGAGGSSPGSSSSPSGSGAGGTSR